MNKDELRSNAAEHIRRTCSDWGGRMVLAALAEDAINHLEENDEESES